MAQEMELHLKDKFLDGLDMKDKSISKIPRYNQFQEIKRLLKDMFSSSTPAIVKFPSATNFRDKLYKLNNLLTDCKMLSRKHGFNSPEELITINRIRRDLRQIKRDLQAITKDASNRDINEQRINGDSSSHDRDILRWTTRAVDATKVYGLDDEVLSMENLLLKKGSDVHQFKAIGIVGRDGIGKTTLCQLMFNKDEVKNNFNPRIWVCMARHPDDDEDEDLKLAIVKRMLRYLGVEEAIVKSICDVKPGLEGLLCALYLQLLGKRYLIVLDDARETDSWYKELDSSLTHDKKWGDSFAFGFPKGSGGRVIVTSRNEDIGNMMVGKENIHHLEPMLDTESCWAIFKDSVDEYLLPTIPSILEELKSEVKQKCGGLPLAAKMMGRAMQEEEERTRS
ncbi:probable disease resistance protein At5g45490 [Rosa rugosa]|uniref:probable disease resistance protein At5g45490 n=1 Tax=Rosa rugosa TaxID=74645 RepID=UPI002B411A2F|nr:probable disease resistance protein At5g45490 [Rosa rugosa]XP_062005308.1 probable disease resistance protein At5g45490 [Rosa rugosa]